MGAAGDATNAGSPLSNALDGKVPETAKPHAIFGADNQHKPAYMQVDLGSDCDVSGVQLWRFFDGGKKYDTTALVASNDPEFAERVPMRCCITALRIKTRTCSVLA